MKDFSTYKLEDFITDESFVNYARGLDPEDIRMWEDWLEKNPAHQETVDEFRNFIIQFFPERQFLPKDFIDNEWNRLSKKIDFKNIKVSSSGKSRNKIRVWHYAAAIALLISISGVLFSGSIFSKFQQITYNEIVVPKGQIKNVLLPDKTLAFLNSDTKLSYDSNFGKKNREVSIEGEVYFKVAHNSNKPFIVHTCEIDIEVLGTDFNVKAYPDGNILQTSLERGKILISDHNKETHILSPNQTYLLIRDINSAKVFTTESVEEYSSWTQGKIILRNHRFIDIAKDLERSHEVIFDIRNKQIQNSRFTGEFSRNDDISKILEIISMTSQFDFEITRDTIIIK